MNSGKVLRTTKGYLRKNGKIVRDAVTLSNYSPIAQYLFEKNINDSSGNDYDLMNLSVSQPVTYTPGKVGRSVIFNTDSNDGRSFNAFNNDDSGLMSNIGPGNNWSLTFWFNRKTAFLNMSNMISIGSSDINDSNLALHIQFEGTSAGSDKLLVYISNASGSHDVWYNSGSYSNNIWNFLGISEDSSGNYYVYINGTYVASGLRAVSYDNGTLRLGFFRINSTNYGSNLYDGLMDQIRIYDFELNSTQMNNIYNSGNGI